MKKIFSLLLIVVLAAGCGKEKCEYNDCAVTAPAAEIQWLQNYLQTNNINATQHCSGIFYTVDQQGTGKWPKGCDYVSVRYQGKFTNGTFFDPQGGGFSQTGFSLGGVIRGFANGILQIKEGGKVTIYVPPSLGYGSQGAGNGAIPPNSYLIFTVELLGIQ